VLSALLLIAARPAQAQTETVLYNFTGGSDGSHPITSLIPDGAGNFYGATELGGSCPGWNGYGCGVVYELSPNGGGGWNETVLHTFSAPPDGANPLYAPVVFDRVGNLYGTTCYGGWDNVGALYELSPAGASWTETVLYSFSSGPSGSCPHGNLIIDPAGNLYGTTGETVFELSPSGGGWTYQVIYTVVDPVGLTTDAAGNILGASDYNVFELSPNGSGGWNPTVIYTFAGAPKDGYGAQGVPVLDQAGNLYGTTYSGGTKNYGTVYKLSPITEGKKKGQWEERILHSFSSGKDGANPSAGVVLDAAGNIYGTTYYGGKSGVGTVFELIAPAGTDKYYKEKVLWTFNGSDGMLPYGNPILDSAGNLYGTANEGGSYNAGVVFEVNPSAAVTTTALGSSQNPSTYGQAVTFTAVVASSAGAPPDGETISFMKGKTVLGTGTLGAGSATFTTSALEVGTYSITAVYGGDFNFLASKSNLVKQVVEKAAE